MSLDNPHGTALITGASGGIGYEFAKLCAKDGYNLVLVARSAGQLQQIADDLSAKYGISATVIAKDLAVPGAPGEVFAELERAGISIDVLINNAGFADYGPFAEADLDKTLQMMQINMVTLTHLTRLVLPGMVARQRGRILNVASTAAFQPGPLMAVYYATKAYVLSFSEAIANELHGTSVSVTALCPGPTETGFQQRAAMEDSKLVAGRQIMDAATVAEAGYRAMRAGRSIEIPGFGNKLGALAPRFVPRGLATRIVRSMQERVSH